LSARCEKCHRPLTSPVSRKRGMGAVCAAKHLLATAKDDDELEQELEALLVEARESGEDPSLIWLALEELKAIRFVRPENAAELVSILDHAICHRLIPDDLQAVFWSVAGFLLGSRNLMALLRRQGFPFADRREALHLVGQLAEIVPEVGTIVKGGVAA
jgi:hypothetical protein